MARRAAAGTVTKRRDESIWRKEGDDSWTQLKDGVAGSGGTGAASKAAGRGGTGQPESLVGEVELPWKRTQARYGLDGHLPPEEVHPQHVQVDAEGNIDAKPVLIWKDAKGAERRTYTNAFHWNRYADSHASQKAVHEALMTSMESLSADVVAGHEPALAALLVLRTGRSPEDVCDLHKERIGVPVAKGSSEDPEHEHRVHLTFKNKDGTAYTTSVSDEHLAGHLRRRTAETEGDGRAFDATPDEVRGLLKSRGLDPDSAAVRHGMQAIMAADVLSKMEPADLAKGGVGGVIQNIRLASQKIAAHLGLEESPEGMSFVPPAVQLAYLEEAGGEHYFPSSYARLKGEPEDKIRKAEAVERAREVVAKAYGSWEDHEGLVFDTAREIELHKARRGRCYPTEDATSSRGLTPTSSGRRETPSSPDRTSGLASTTPGPSARSSPAPSPNHEGLEKAGGYLARLAPGPGELRARYVYDKDVLDALLASEHFGAVVQPGSRFLVQMGGVDGYADVIARRDTLVELQHSGTGRRGSDGVEALRALLLRFHKAAPEEPEPAPDRPPELKLEAAAPSSAPEPRDDDDDDDDDDDVEKSGRKERDLIREGARAAYQILLRKNVAGHLPDDVMKKANAALYHDDFAGILELFKSVEPHPGASSGAGKPGPTGDAVGTMTRRKSGKYEKVSQGQWERVPEGREKRGDTRKPVTRSDLHELLSHLRARLHDAPKGQREELKRKIEVVKKKLQALADADTRKSDASLRAASESLRDVAVDPVDRMLVKSSSTGALDDFMGGEFDDYAHFVELLGKAPLEARVQAQLLRLTKGAGALRSRWDYVRRDL